MAYTKQYFEDGSVLYASQLNHMEEGISAALEQSFDLDEIVEAVLSALPDGDEVSY